MAYVIAEPCIGTKETNCVPDPGALREDSEYVRMVLESNAGNVHHAW